jgi:hypothetical protein
VRRARPTAGKRDPPLEVCPSEYAGRSWPKARRLGPRGRTWYGRFRDRDGRVSLVLADDLRRISDASSPRPPMTTGPKNADIRLSSGPGDRHRFSREDWATRILATHRMGRTAPDVDGGAPT